MTIARKLGWPLGALVMLGAGSARAVPPRTTCEEIASAAVVPNPGGGFTILLATPSGKLFEQYVNGMPTLGRPARLATDGRVVAATRGQGSAGAYVAVVRGPSAAPVSTFRLDMSDAQSRAGTEFAVAMGRSERDAAPLVAWLGDKLTVQRFGSDAGVEVPLPAPATPAGLDSFGFGATSQGAIVAYPSSTGATVLRLTAGGGPSGSPPLALTDGLPGLRVSVTELGDDLLVSYWPRAFPPPRGPTVERLSPSSGASLERRVLEIGTSGLVADPDAPGGPNVRVVRNDGTRNLESAWRPEPPPDAAAPEAGADAASDGGVLSSRVLGTEGELMAGACSAEGCFYVYTSQRFDVVYPAAYAPRVGPVAVGELSRPSCTTEYGSDGSTRPRDSGAAETEGGASGADARESLNATEPSRESGCAVGVMVPERTPLGPMLAGLLGATGLVWLARRRMGRGSR